MSARIRIVIRGRSATDALEAWDLMHPFEHRWIERSNIGSSVCDYLVWFESRIDALVETANVIAFIENIRGPYVVVHPFIRPDCRTKVRDIAEVLRALVSEWPGIRPIVRTTYAASRSVVRLLRKCGFVERGHFIAGAESARLEHIPMLEWERQD
jgi:hypothetical protein